MRKNSGNGSELPSDAYLMELAASGDERGFAMMAEKYRPMLTAMSNRLLRNSDDASDVVQETLFKAYRSFSDFTPGKPLKPWLCRICSNCCIDSVRRSRRESSNFEGEEEIPEMGPGVDEQVGGSLVRAQIMEAVSRLPVRYQKIVLMRHVRDMEVSEIATQLEKPEGTIKSWLFRARALLRKDLRPVFG